MPLSFQEWQNPNQGTPVAIGIEYISVGHLHWTADGMPVQPVDVVDGVAYFGGSLPAGTQLLRVVRKTPREAMPHVFSDGALFREASVDRNFKWALLTGQEDSELVDAQFNGDVDIAGSLDVSGPVTITGNVGLEGDVDVDGTLVTRGNLETDGNITAQGTVVADTLRPTTGASANHLPGEIFWDDVEKCLAYQGDTPGTFNQIGRGLWRRCHNNSGVTIPKGAVVVVTGAVAGYPTVRLATSLYDSNLPTLGVATQDIPNNSYGEVTTVGDVNGIDTSAFVEGASLYLGTVAGQLVDVLPAPPAHAVAVGICTRSHATHGRILVRILDAGSASTSDPSSLTLADPVEDTDVWAILRPGVGWFKASFLKLREHCLAWIAANSLNVGGDLRITGIGRKITADLTSNPGRMVLQNSVSNHGSVWTIVPNGTANTSQTNAHNNADWQNSTFSRCGVIGTEVFHTGNNTGTGAPCTLYRWGPSMAVNWTMDAAGVVTGAGGAAKFGNYISAPALVADATGVAGDAEVICTNNLGSIGLTQGGTGAKGIPCTGPSGVWDGWLIYRPVGTTVTHLGVDVPAAAGGYEVASAGWVRGRIAEAAFASGSTPTWQQVWIGNATSVSGSALTGGALAGVYRVVSAEDYQGASGVISIGSSVEGTAVLSVSNGGTGVLSVLTLRFTSGDFMLVERNLNVGAGTYTDTPSTITAIYRLV